MAEVATQGIPCLAGSCSEIYRERAFTDCALGPSRPLPVARELGETSLMFLVHPTLAPEDMAEAGRVVEEVCSLATR